MGYIFTCFHTTFCVFILSFSCDEIFNSQEEKESWVWKKPPPRSRKQVITGNPEERKRVRREIKSAQYMSVKEKLLKGLVSLLTLILVIVLSEITSLLELVVKAAI